MPPPRGSYATAVCRISRPGSPSTSPCGPVNGIPAVRPFIAISLMHRLHLALSTVGAVVVTHVVLLNLSEIDEQSETVGHIFRLSDVPCARLTILPASRLTATAAFRLLTRPDANLPIAAQKSNFQLWPFQLGPELRHLHKRNSQLRPIQLQTGTYPQVKLFTIHRL